MPRAILNQPLLAKMARKQRLTEKSLREEISRKASKRGVSSLAMQLIMAQGNFGIGNILRKVAPEIQQQVREAGNQGAQAGPSASRSRIRRGRVGMQQTGLSAKTVRFMLADRQLLGRCTDLLLKRRHHDRVVREATTILEDRIRALSNLKGLTADALVGKAISPDPSKAVIEVSPEAGQQQGFHSICRGIVQVFRNKFHHSISDRFTQADALRVCGFIDTVLAVLGGATIHKDRATT